jgi:hypothetical protein
LVTLDEEMRTRVAPLVRSLTPAQWLSGAVAGSP